MIQTVSELIKKKINDLQQERDEAYDLLRRVALALGGEMDQGVAAWWVNERGDRLVTVAGAIYQIAKKSEPQQVIECHENIRRQEPVTIAKENKPTCEK